MYIGKQFYKFSLITTRFEFCGRQPNVLLGHGIVDT
jgi:hypothetical protein